MISDTDPNFAAYYEAMHRRSILLVVAVALLAACSNAASNSALPHSTESVSTSAEVSTTAATLATADTAATALTNTTVAASAPTSAAPTTTAKPKAKLKPSAPTTTSTVAPGPYTSAIYADPAHWICRGDVTNDVCDSSYPVTAVAADGTLTINPSDKAADPPIDCFYVYPTSSEDTTMASDFTAGAEVTTTILQAARFNQVCRVFAPIYRSVTNAGLSRAFSAGDPQFAGAWNQAYLDVLDAWRQYLAHDNNGRPVVIIAHSQGSFHVVRLLKEEIDPKPEQRSLIVSAIVAGTSFQVATGRDVGGDTQNMPLPLEHSVRLHHHVPDIPRQRAAPTRLIVWCARLNHRLSVHQSRRPRWWSCVARCRRAYGSVDLRKYLHRTHDHHSIHERAWPCHRRMQGAQRLPLSRGHHQRRSNRCPRR